MKIKKLFVTVICFITLASLVLSGCSGSNSPQPSSSPSTSTPSQTQNDNQQAAAPDASGPSNTAAEPETPVLEGKISFSIWDVDTQMPYIREMLDDFTSRNPGIEVEVVDIPSADYNTKLSIDLNGGAAADVIMVKDASTMYSMNQKGQLADLSGYISRDNLNLGAFNGLDQNFLFDGKQVGLPFRTDYYILFYNKDIFDAAGVEYPSNDMTWFEYEELAKKVTSGEGQDKIYGAHLHTWQAMVQNCAVQDGKNTIMGPDYQFMKPYYEMALRMQNVDKTIQDFATLKTANIHYSGVFQNGSVATMPMGTWFMATMIDVINKGESNVNWGIATLPHPEGLEAGRTVGSATPITINAASSNKDAAWELVKFMTGDYGASYLALAGQLPARVNAELLDAITSIDGMPEGAKEALQVKGIVLDRPNVEYVNEVNQMLGEEHSLIMLGEKSIDEGLEAFAEQSKVIQGL